MTRRAVVRIPAEMLGPLLQLPEGLEVLHVAVGNYGLAFDLVLTAPDMAETDTEIGAVPPMLHPLYELADGAVRIIDIDYPREQSAAEPVVDPATTGAPR